MKFRRGSAHHLVSDCSHYTIAKVIVGGDVLYEAWHLPNAKTGEPGIALANRKASSLDCIQSCRRHAEQRAKKTA